MSNYALRLPESHKQAAKRIAATHDTTMNQFLVVQIALFAAALRFGVDADAELTQAADSRSAFEDMNF